MTKQIFTGDRRLNAPMEGLLLQDQIDETLPARGAVPIDEHRRHIGHLACFKCVAEDECENGRQDQEQDQDTPVPIDMEKLFVSHARDGAERTSIHDSVGFKITSYPCE
jgi:hypothetical protein